MALPPSGLLCRRGTRLSAPDPSPLRIRPRRRQRRGWARRDEAQLGEHPEAARRRLGRAPVGAAAAQRLAQLLPARLAGLAQRAEERRRPPPARPAARRATATRELDLGLGPEQVQEAGAGASRAVGAEPRRAAVRPAAEARRVDQDDVLEAARRGSGRGSSVA